MTSFSGLLMLCSLATMTTIAGETTMPPSGQPSNLLPSLGRDESKGEEVNGWVQRVWSGDDIQLSIVPQGRTGNPCFLVSSENGADAAWTTTVAVEKYVWYRLSGWIKTEGVAGATGALLNIQNMQSVRTAAVSGTQDWTYVTATFRAEAAVLEINGLFGGWGQSTGLAWYDDISLEPVAAHLPTEVDIRLNAAKVGAVISPQLFGHNLEHTRRAIWRGLSAEMVANRKFAAVDSGLAKHWWTLPDGGVSVDDAVAYTGTHSIRMERVGATPHCGIWQQHDWLAFGQGEKYVFRVWARSDSPQSFQMRVVTRSGFTNVFAEQNTVTPGDWQLWRGEFTAPCPARGAKLEIRLLTEGPVWIGAVSMMPADNFHGMRRDVVDLLKQLKPGNLRWPGGCFAEYYDWREGLLPVDQRPPVGPHQWVGLLPDSDGYDNHDIGIDEYIALCRELNAAPAITTRFSEGSPEEAAAWVEYCNGATTTRWGKIRAERGHPEPYRVDYWYAGNELTGMSLLKGEARTDPSILAALCREHIAAMKRADPTIQLNVGIPASPDWLGPLFDAADGMIDEVQTGFYFAPDSEMSMADMAYTPVHSILPGLRQLRRSLDSIAPAGKPMGISYYEWNVMWDRSGDARSGVFTAAMLNMFCREADSLGLVRASYFQPVTEGAIAVGPRTSEFEPDGQVFALFAPHQGNRLLHAAFNPDGAIDMCATLAPDSKSIYVTAINRSGKSACAVRLSLEGLSALRGASAELLIPETLEAESKFTQRSEEPEILDGNTLVLELPRLSVAGLCLATGEPGE